MLAFVRGSYLLIFVNVIGPHDLCLSIFFHNGFILLLVIIVYRILWTLSKVVKKKAMSHLTAWLKIVLFFHFPK